VDIFVDGLLRADSESECENSDDTEFATKEFARLIFSGKEIFKIFAYVAINFIIHITEIISQGINAVNK